MFYVILNNQIFDLKELHRNNFAQLRYLLRFKIKKFVHIFRKTWFSVLKFQFIVFNMSELINFQNKVCFSYSHCIFRLKVVENQLNSWTFLSI